MATHKMWIMLVRSVSVEKVGFRLNLIPHSKNKYKVFVHKLLFLPLAISY